MPRQPRAQFAFLALLTGAVGIAFAPVFVRLSETGPGATAFYRILFALPLLWLWMGLENKNDPSPRQPATRREFGQLALAGLFFAADLAVWHWSIKKTSVANSTLLANFTPIFVTLGARLLFGEKITGLFVLGMTLALSGATMLVGAGLNLSAAHLSGDALGILTAVFYAAYMLTIKQLRGTFSTATIMSWSGLSSSLALLVIALLSGDRMLAVSGSGWALLAGLALFSQVGGQSFIAYAFAHLPASLASVTLLFQPVVAALLAWLILGEPVGWLQGLGGSVVLIGIGVAGRASR